MGCKAEGRRTEWGRWWGWGPLRKQGCVNKSYSLGKGAPQAGHPLSSLVGVQLSVFQLRCTKWPCRKGCCGKWGLLGLSSCFPILHVRSIVATSDGRSSLKCSPAEGRGVLGSHLTSSSGACLNDSYEQWDIMFLGPPPSPPLNKSYQVQHHNFS